MRKLNVIEMHQTQSIAAEKHSHSEEKQQRGHTVTATGFANENTYYEEQRNYEEKELNLHNTLFRQVNKTCCRRASENVHLGLRLKMATLVPDGLNEYTFTVTTGEDTYCGDGTDNRAHCSQ